MAIFDKQGRYTIKANVLIRKSDYNYVFIVLGDDNKSIIIVPDFPDFESTSKLIRNKRILGYCKTDAKHRIMLKSISKSICQRVNEESQAVEYLKFENFLNLTVWHILWP